MNRGWFIVGKFKFVIIFMYKFLFFKPTMLVLVIKIGDK